MTYLMAFESKPEAGQTHRGSRRYMTATQAINAAKKMAEKQYNASAMKTTATGNLEAVLWSTNAQMITAN